MGVVGEEQRAQPIPTPTLPLVRGGSNKKITTSKIVKRGGMEEK